MLIMYHNFEHTWEDTERLLKILSDSTKQLIDKHRTPENKRKYADLALELVTAERLGWTDTASYKDAKKKIAELRTQEFRDFNSKIYNGKDDCVHYWMGNGCDSRRTPFIMKYKCTLCDAKVELEDQTVF